jgi:hypothetical protein
MMRRLRGSCLALLLVLLVGCDPPHLSDTYATSTPKPKSFDTSELVRTPVVVLAFLTPANLQGFEPLSNASTMQRSKRSERRPTGI